MIQILCSLHSTVGRIGHATYHMNIKLICYSSKRRCQSPLCLTLCNPMDHGLPCTVHGTSCRSTGTWPFLPPGISPQSRIKPVFLSSPGPVKILTHWIFVNILVWTKVHILGMSAYKKSLCTFKDLYEIQEIIKKILPIPP